MKLVGAHRIKRVPPTEKKGRRHTSTLMVVAVETAVSDDSRVAKRDVREEFLRTSGKGGQRKNKVSTAVRLTHMPTGVTVVADGEREQAKNRTIAWTRLEEKLAQASTQKEQDRLRHLKQDQFVVDEFWTWTEYLDQVISPTGQKLSYRKALRGQLAGLLA